MRFCSCLLKLHCCWREKITTLRWLNNEQYVWVRESTLSRHSSSGGEAYRHIYKAVSLHRSIWSRCVAVLIAHWRWCVRVCEWRSNGRSKRAWPLIKWWRVRPNMSVLTIQTGHCCQVSAHNLHRHKHTEAHAHPHPLESCYYRRVSIEGQLSLLFSTTRQMKQRSEWKHIYYPPLRSPSSAPPRLPQTASWCWPPTRQRTCWGFRARWRSLARGPWAFCQSVAPSVSCRSREVRTAGSPSRVCSLQFSVCVEDK